MLYQVNPYIKEKNIWNCHAFADVSWVKVITKRVAKGGGVNVDDSSWGPTFLERDHGSPRILTIY